MAINDVVGSYEQWSMVILYDPKTGDIVHTHQAVTAKGGTAPDQNTLEQLAVGHAARAKNKPVEGVGFLHVAPGDIDFSARYTVDVKSRSLRKLDPAKPKA